MASTGKKIGRLGDWEELNKETYVCNVCYKTASRCSFARKYKLAYIYICPKIFA